MQCRVTSCSKSRHLLKILSILTCCVFVFVLYFVNGVQHLVQISVERDVSSSASSNCARPIRWFAPAGTGYSVLFNYAQSDNVYKFNDSVTYVTHATFRFLCHLRDIALRWDGPISVAVYAPATDFDAALDAIAHLRACGPPSLRHSTTFHLFYDVDLKPLSIPCSFDEHQTTIYGGSSTGSGVKQTLDCSCYEYPNSSYQVDNNLTYPVNVARNIARLSAQTKYVLVSDIELYPSANMAPMFINMTRTLDSQRTVYVLPIFEVDKKFVPPAYKTQLVDMMKRKLVVPFHKFVCIECHRVPKQEQWLSTTVDPTAMAISYTTKRHKPYHNWEPVYIGSNDEPLYDGRLNWEGMSDKMTQAFEMCLLDYNFSILDNAFLVHAPGIKRLNRTANLWRRSFEVNNSRIRKQIKKELLNKYKANANCSL